MPRPLFNSGPERNAETADFVAFSNSEDDDSDSKSESDESSGETGVDNDVTPDWVPTQEPEHNPRVLTVPSGVTRQQFRARLATPQLPDWVPTQEPEQEPEHNPRELTVPSVTRQQLRARPATAQSPTTLAIAYQERYLRRTQHRERRERIPIDDGQFYRGPDNQMLINWIMFDSLVVLVQLNLVLFSIVFIESVLLIMTVS